LIVGSHFSETSISISLRSRLTRRMTDIAFEPIFWTEL
jgi:hypothetical protein